MMRRLSTSEQRHLDLKGVAELEEPSLPQKKHPGSHRTPSPKL